MFKQLNEELQKYIELDEEQESTETILFDGGDEWDLQIILKETEEGYCVISKLANEIVEETTVHEFATDAIKEWIEICKEENAVSDLFSDMLADKSKFNTGNAGQAIYLLDKLKELTDEPEEDEQGIPCVIIIEDIGNGFAFIDLVEKDTNIKSQYDVEVEYQDEELDPTLQYVLAYYKDGEFYDENGENMNLEDIDMDESLDEAMERYLSVEPIEGGFLPNTDIEYTAQIVLYEGDVVVDSIMIPLYYDEIKGDKDDYIRSIAKDHFDNITDDIRVTWF